VSKALSLRTSSTEQEEPGRKEIWLGGRQYARSTVKGELTFHNHRAEEILLVIRRRLSGEVVSAEGEPRKVVREEGVYSLNQRWELVWTVPLKAGEGKKLAYQYTVLVPR
jgi:hypothetical protein